MSRRRVVRDDDCCYLFSNNLAEECSDEDNENEDEENMEEETQTTDKQGFGNLQTFRTLGCEVTDISKGVLFTDAPIINLSSSAAECHQLLKVCLAVDILWSKVTS